MDLEKGMLNHKHAITVENKITVAAIDKCQCLLFSCQPVFQTAFTNDSETV